MKVVCDAEKAFSDIFSDLLRSSLKAFGLIKMAKARILEAFAARVELLVGPQVYHEAVIDHFVTDKFVEFRPYWRNVPRGYVEKHKDAVDEQELTQNIIGGYTKTIYSRNIFESKQEKWLADILDRDEEIVRWVRPPTGQMPIAYKGGNYNPDFVVEAKGDRFFVIEAKARDEISNQDVQAKARAGLEWCKVMSKATGKVWEYKLNPHDAIQPTASFAGVISNAVTMPEKTDGG